MITTETSKQMYTCARCGRPRLRECLGTINDEVYCVEGCYMLARSEMLEVSELLDRQS